MANLKQSSVKYTRNYAPYSIHINYYFVVTRLVEFTKIVTFYANLNKIGNNFIHL